MMTARCAEFQVVAGPSETTGSRFAAFRPATAVVARGCS